MSSDAPRRTILCACCEQDLLDSIYAILNDFYNIKIANSAPDALMILRDEDIAVVISDQMVPSMTGLELLEEIHKIKPHCKKILLATRMDIHAVIDAITRGVINKYLTKPWDREEIIMTAIEMVEEYNSDELMMDMLLHIHTMLPPVNSEFESS